MLWRVRAVAVRSLATAPKMADGNQTEKHPRKAMIAGDSRPAKHRILVVEDDQASQELVRALLEGAGYLVEVTGAASIALQRVNDLAPALVLVDLNLPGWDGLWLTRELQKRPETAGIPVVALTGRVGLRDREAAHLAGCVGFISKPIDTRTFGERVARYISGTGAD
jgi:two-component system, cell cycle response regulator DivK